MDPQTQRELDLLLSALLDGELSAAEQERLGELLRTHPEAREHYLAYLELHGELALHVGGEKLPEPRLPAAVESAVADTTSASVPAPAVRRRRRAWATAAAGLAAAVLLTLLLWPRKPAGPTRNDPATEPLDTSVAVLLHAPGAVWEGASPPRSGAALQPGWLRLKAGLAHLEFYCGAIVIMQGPAELRLVSRTEAYCARGKLRATVPPQAHGFTIGSPQLDLVDRGTEFGLDVAPGGRTEVHVFQGEVDLYKPGADRKTAAQKKLLTGEGVRQDGAGAAQPIRLNPAAFVTARELARRSEEELRRCRERWLELCKEYDDDEALLAHYTFEAGRPWSRTLSDRTRVPHEPRDAAIVGCSWGPGRWPGKQGLEFKRVSDRVRLKIPGEYESITLMAWVRVDGLPNLNNSLFMADGWEPGEFHWQIGEKGKLVLGVQSNPKSRGAHYHAFDVLTPERYGQWLHLAVVYDGGEDGLVSHYVNGQLVQQEEVQFPIPLRIGEAEIGNWNVASHRNNTPIRFLSGCMDEFLIFARPLSAAEVERHYKVGRPPQ